MALIGLVLLPFNVAHLGPVGLRPLGADGLDHDLLLGARPRLRRRAGQVRRAVPGAARSRRRSTRSSARCSSCSRGVGVVTFVVTAGIAWQFGRFFHLTPDQIDDGRLVLLIIGAFIAVRFALSVFGA